MTLIHVPRPPASAYNPHRRASSLLRTQVEHMHLAEKRLPLRYRTEMYVNAIRTEAEVAEYVGKVTEAIRRAHEDAQRKRTKSARPATILKLAASASKEPQAKGNKKRAAVSNAKKKSVKKKR